jgi:beta-lactamase class C
MLPRGEDSSRGHLSPEHRSRAVQGYADDGTAVGEPGTQESYYHWPGTGQMYSSRSSSKWQNEPKFNFK